MSHTIVGIGEFIWDIFPNAVEPGGAVANVIQHAHHMGENAFLVSRVGDDVYGNDFFKFWRNHGLSTDYVTKDSELPTGSITIKHHPNGDATYSQIPQIASDFIPYTNEIEKLALSADAICFGCFGQWGKMSRDTIHAVLGQARPECLKVVDINLRPGRYTQQLVLSSINEASVLKLNDDELKVVATYLKLSGNPTSQLQFILQNFNLQMVALTRGSKGSLLIAQDGTVDDHPGFQVNVIDTVGAGDAFTAAIVVGLLRKMPLQKLNSFANQVGSFTCTQLGAAPILPRSLLRQLDQ